MTTYCISALVTRRLTGTHFANFSQWRHRRKSSVTCTVYSSSSITSWVQSQCFSLMYSIECDKLVLVLTHALTTNTFFVWLPRRSIPSLIGAFWLRLQSHYHHVCFILTEFSVLVVTSLLVAILRVVSMIVPIDIRARSFIFLA